MRKVILGLSALLMVGNIALAAEAGVDISEEELDKIINEKVEKILEEEKKEEKKDFEFHGYFRSGALINSDGHGGKSFDKWSPIGGFHPTGRLGNEDETYGELEFVKNFYAENGSWAKAHVLLAYETGSLNDWDSVTSDTHLRNAFVEMGGLPTFKGAFKDSVIWAGKRFYGREDVHITDYYIRDFSGTGGGIQNVKVGSGEMDLAFIGRSFDDYTPIGSDYEIEGQVYTLDGRYRIKNWEFELAGHISADNGDRKGDSDFTQKNRDQLAENGVQGYVSYNLPKYYGFKEGFSKVYGQLGYGLGAELGTSGGYATNYEDEVAWEVGSYGQATLNSKWDLMTTVTYNGKINTVNSDGDEYDFSWFNLAARPVYKINENFELQFEAGYTMYDDENTDRTGGIGKVTFAPTYKFDTTEFFGRPELRVFVTYAHWNDDYDEDMHDTLGDYSNQDGLNFGVQAEVWF